jgi:hypothetical protein
MIDARAGTAAGYLPFFTFFDFAVKKEKTAKEEKNTCNIRSPVVPFLIRGARSGLRENFYERSVSVMKKRVLVSVNCFTPPPVK